MAAILCIDAEPFEHIDNTPSTGGPVCNLVKKCYAVSEKKTFKEYNVLYMYLAQGQGQIIPGDKLLTVTNRVCFFDHT